MVILGVTGGSSLFGIAGAFFAVPVLAVVAEVLRYLLEQVDRVAGDPEPPPHAPPQGPPEPAGGAPA